MEQFVLTTSIVFGSFYLSSKQKKNNKECTVRIERLESNDLEKNAIDGIENVDTLNQITQNNAPAKRYRTRSSVMQSDSLTDGVQPERKKSNSIGIPRPTPSFIEYNGKVEYFTEFHDIAFASDNLL